MFEHECGDALLQVGCFDTESGVSSFLCIPSWLCLIQEAMMQFHLSVVNAGQYDFFLSILDSFTKAVLRRTTVTTSQGNAPSVNREKGFLLGKQESGDSSTASADEFQRIRKNSRNWLL